MVFILGVGLEVFILGLLWVCRCGDVGRGCKITAPGGSSCAMQGTFAPGEGGSCGAGRASSCEERTADECCGRTGMAWMFLRLLKVKQACEASWGCTPLAGCVRKELDLLYYCMLVGKTVFCCVWCEMGQQQLPQQPVSPLLCPAVEHLRVALQRSLELGLSAVRASHDVWVQGNAGMGARRLLSFLGVIFPPLPTVLV